MIPFDSVNKLASVPSGRKSASALPAVLGVLLRSLHLSYTISYSFAMTKFQMMN